MRVVDPIGQAVQLLSRNKGKLGEESANVPNGQGRNEDGDGVAWKYAPGTGQHVVAAGALVNEYGGQGEHMSTPPLGLNVLIKQGRQDLSEEILDMPGSSTDAYRALLK